MADVVARAAVDRRAMRAPLAGEVRVRFEHAIETLRGVCRAASACAAGRRRCEAAGSHRGRRALFTVGSRHLAFEGGGAEGSARSSDLLTGAPNDRGLGVPPERQAGESAIEHGESPRLDGTSTAPL